MNWFYSKVIKYRKLIMLVFAGLTVFCGMMYPRVRVDYDVLNYLPQDTQSTVAIDFMANEFGGNVPNARVVVRDVNKQEALEFKEKLESIDGVSSVTWVDSMLPIDMPLEVLPGSMADTYYQDGNAMFSLTIEEEKQLETVPAIYDLIGEDNMLSGQSVNTVVATLNTIKEVAKITVIGVLFLIFVLIMTTTSWVEPAIIMLGLGVAVIINAGSNIIFGKISFVTNSAGMILQMAVSLDYSVFLIHRFEECRRDTDPETAMQNALVLSTPSILSSGLTTVIGFLALAFMKFLLGADLGLALSKGVAISLITSLIFMPGVILATYKWMEKGRHRSFMPSFERFGRFVRRATIPLGIAFVLIIVPSYIGSIHNSYLYGGSRIYGPETRLGHDTEETAKLFGDSDTYVLIVPRGDNTAEHALIRELKDDERVTSVLSPISLIGEALPPELLPDSIVSKLRTDKYDRIAVSVAVPIESANTFDLVEKIYGIADKYYPDEYYFAGSGVSMYDLKQVVTSDMVRVNMIAILSVFFILLLMMKNLLLPVILVLTIETAIWFNMSISYVTGAPLFYIAYLIISSVQLGATVDYAILFTNRYKENRLELGLRPFDCIVTTISDTAVSILTSAIAVSVMGFLLGIFSSQRVIAQIGMLLGRGTLCSLFAVLFILPGLLAVFDRLVIGSFSLKRRHKREEM